MGLGGEFKESSGFDFEYSSNIQLRLKLKLFFFVLMFSPKVNMEFCLYQPHSHLYVQ